VTGLLIFIKHRLPFLWRGIDWLNAVLFRLLHGDRVDKEAERCFREFTLQGYQFRALNECDLEALSNLLDRQTAGRLDYFKPHRFDRKSLERVVRNPAFLMFGAFNNDLLVGYFFLRCFWNRKCFVGRLIDEPYERKGIGRVMNQILYHTAWRAEFRCLTTVSKNNALVMRSHANNPTFRVLKELPNDYLFVEFVQPKQKGQG
jgi:hypothetical protein